MSLTNIPLSILLIWVSVFQCFAADYYLFPIKEIEGLSTRGDANYRPLVDRKVLEYLPADNQKKILEQFEKSLYDAYPNATVSQKQVGNVVKGKYLYLPQANCGSEFTAPIKSSYAVTLGVTRASEYIVEKGNNLEILIPITLNIQVIKPDLAKIIYTTSSTQYSPFVMTKNEYGSPSGKELIKNSLTINMAKQLKELISLTQANFNPKDTKVKILRKIENFYVVDKGFETGFKVGDEPESYLTKDPSQVAVFSVMSVSKDYSILKLQSDQKIQVKEGDDFNFLFEGTADDSQKPKLMPVINLDKNLIWSSSAVDLFQKNIGFNAPFQITPVDINFTDTMSHIMIQANCVKWDNYPNAKPIQGSRANAPNYFLRFEYGESPVFTQRGSGGTRTSESFGVAVTAQVVSTDGTVLFSELGKNNYVLDKVDNIGLHIRNAKEIAFKNAVNDLTNNFLKNVKLEHKEFTITEVKGNKLIIDGLKIPDEQDLIFEVFHRLGANNLFSKPVLMKILIDKSNELPRMLDGKTILTYAAISPGYPPIEAGDIIRVAVMPKDNLPELSYCGEVVQSPGSLNGDFMLPLINYVAHKSSKYIVSISNSDFYADANKQLEQGFFKYRIPDFIPTSYCYKPAYALKKLENNCESGKCSAKMISALGLKIAQKINVADSKDTVFAEQITISGFEEPQLDNLISFKGFDFSLTKYGELLKRFNSK